MSWLGQPRRTETGEQPEDFSKVGAALLLSVALGLVLVAIQSRVVGCGLTPLVWALSCLAVGVAVGFLFGIPKAVQKASQPADAAATEGVYQLRVNTNLEEISDWLTKIIVGVGLVELKTIPPYVNRIAGVLALAMGNAEANRAFALGVIVYFGVVGFLSGYLATRLYLAAAFARADQRVSVLIEALRELAAKLSPELLSQLIQSGSFVELMRGQIPARVTAPAAVPQTTPADTGDESEQLDGALGDLQAGKDVTPVYLPGLAWRKSPASFSEQQQRVLLALSHRKHIWRTRQRLLEVTGLPQEDLDAALSELIRADLLRPSCCASPQGSPRQRDIIFGLSERVG